MDDKQLEQVSGGSQFLTESDVGKLKDLGFRVRIVEGSEEPDTMRAEYNVFDSLGNSISVAHSIPDPNSNWAKMGLK